MSICTQQISKNVLVKKKPLKAEVERGEGAETLVEEYYTELVDWHEAWQPLGRLACALWVVASGS
jgi:hypothetical protein